MLVSGAERGTRGGTGALAWLWKFRSNEGRLRSEEGGVRIRWGLRMGRRRNGRASIGAGSSSSSSLGGCGVTQTYAARALAGLLLSTG